MGPKDRGQERGRGASALSSGASRSRVPSPPPSPTDAGPSLARTGVSKGAECRRPPSPSAPAAASPARTRVSKGAGVLSTPSPPSPPLRSCVNETQPSLAYHGVGERRRRRWRRGGGSTVPPPPCLPQRGRGEAVAGVGVSPTCAQGVLAPLRAPLRVSGGKKGGGGKPSFTAPVCAWTRWVRKEGGLVHESPRVVLHLRTRLRVSGGGGVRRGRGKTLLHAPPSARGRGWARQKGGLSPRRPAFAYPVCERRQGR